MKPLSQNTSEKKKSRKKSAQFLIRRPLYNGQAADGLGNSRLRALRGTVMRPLTYIHNLYTKRNFGMYTEKNLLVNFTIFIKKFIIFLVTLGHTQNLEFLLF